MPSLIIIVACILSTLTLAFPITGLGPEILQTNLCPSQSLNIEVPYINSVSFTLLSVSKANNSVQMPLALSSAPAASPGVYWLATANSMDIEADMFYMYDGGISTTVDPHGDLVAVSNPVGNENSPLPFSLPPAGSTITPAPARAYCELVNASRHGVEYSYIFTLAVNINLRSGDGNHFSLCKHESSPGEDGYVVVYNATEAISNKGGISWTACTAVEIYMLPF